MSTNNLDSSLHEEGWTHSQSLCWQRITRLLEHVSSKVWDNCRGLDVAVSVVSLNLPWPSKFTKKLTILRLEKLFAEEIAAYTSITGGIRSQYFFLYDKIRQFGATGEFASKRGTIIWKIPSLKFVFDSAKTARPSSDPLFEAAASFTSLIFTTHPHGYNFLSNFTVMLSDPQLASMNHFYSPSSLATMTTFSNGPSQRSSTLVIKINWIHWTPERKRFSLIKKRPKKAHSLNKNRSFDSHHQPLDSSLSTL